VAYDIDCEVVRTYDCVHLDVVPKSVGCYDEIIVCPSVLIVGGVMVCQYVSIVTWCTDCTLFMLTIQDV